MPQKKKPKPLKITIPRAFVRSIKFSPTDFRVFMHGYTYPNGWSIEKCVKETGIAKKTVKESIRALEFMGYVFVRRSPDHHWMNYTFSTIPVTEEQADAARHGTPLKEIFKTDEEQNEN